MEEKIIVSAKTSKGPVVFRLVLIGGIFMATCTVWDYIDDWAMFLSFGLGAIIALFGLYLLFVNRDCEFFVTNKRVYGKTFFGKRVDLPLDSISAVALTNSLFAGISVSSSSGRITFAHLKNRNGVYKELSNILIERQSGELKYTTEVIEKNDKINDIKRLKELLDIGAITQEEFDAKKKELLGL